MTQQQLAKATGVDASYVSRLEREERLPGAAMLERLAGALEVPLHLLMLLASTKQEIDKRPAAEIDLLARMLLDVLIGDDDDV